MASIDEFREFLKKWTKLSDDEIDNICNSIKSFEWDDLYRALEPYMTGGTIKELLGLFFKKKRLFEKMGAKKRLKRVSND